MKCPAVRKQLFPRKHHVIKKKKNDEFGEVISIKYDIEDTFPPFNGVFDSIEITKIYFIDSEKKVAN